MINLNKSMGLGSNSGPLYQQQTRYKLHYGARFIYSMNAEVVSFLKFHIF